MSIINNKLIKKSLSLVCVMFVFLSGCASATSKQPNNSSTKISNVDSIDNFGEMMYAFSDDTLIIPLKHDIMKSQKLILIKQY